MPPRFQILLNTPEIELWPAGTLRARGNAHAPLLARAGWVLPPKRDGQSLAAALDDGLHPLVANLAREPGLATARRALDALRAPRRAGIDAARTLPLHRLQERLETLGLDTADYAARTELT